MLPWTFASGPELSSKRCAGVPVTWEGKGVQWRGQSVLPSSWVQGSLWQGFGPSDFKFLFGLRIE